MNVRFFGLAASTLAVVAYIGVAFLGGIAWRDAAADGQVLTGLHVLLVAGLAPLITGMILWLSAKSWRDFVVGIGFAATFVIAHFVIAAYVAHEPRDWGTAVMLGELVIALAVTLAWRRRASVRSSL